MPKLPQFLAKLTTKQIYGVFGIATILFLIIGFLVAQNIQNLGKNSTNSKINSNSNLIENQKNKLEIVNL